MTIVITDAKDALYLTQSEYDRLNDEYQRAFMYYYGTPPSFEDWVRKKQKPVVTTDNTKTAYVLNNK